MKRGYRISISSANKSCGKSNDRQYSNKAMKMGTAESVKTLDAFMIADSNSDSKVALTTRKRKHSFACMQTPQLERKHAESFRNGS